MKPVVALVLTLLLPVLAVSGDSPILARDAGTFSLDDFDWRDTIPDLSLASGLAGEQGIKALLENTRALRAYVAQEIQTECASGARPCIPPGATLQGEVSKRIDEIVQEGITHHRHITRLDFPLARQPFPFTHISAVQAENRDTYLVLFFADNICSAARLRAKYGDPYDTNVVEWYSVYIYKVENKNYTVRASFKIDPVDGAVIMAAIGLHRKGRH